MNEVIQPRLVSGSQVIREIDDLTVNRVSDEGRDKKAGYVIPELRFARGEAAVQQHRRLA